MKTAFSERFSANVPVSKIERTKLDDLELEHRRLVEQMELGTDEIFEYRTQLASFFRKYRHDLYEAIKAEGPQASKRLFGTFDFLIEQGKQGRGLEQILVLDEPQDDQGVLRQLEFVSALEQALGVYEALKRVHEDHRVRTDGSDAPELDAFYKARHKELGEAAWVRTEMQAQKRRLEGMLEMALNSRSAPQVVAKIEAQIADLQKKAKEYFTSRPETWLLAKGLDLQEMKRTFDEDGRIVETPYVKQQMRHIEAKLASNRPVFVFGELGSGKTELAKHLAYTRLSAPHVARWEAKNPESRVNDREAHEAWEAEREAQREAIVISGHRQIDSDTMLAARKVERKQAPTPETQVEFMREAWERHQAALTAKNIKLSETELQHERELLERGYLELFRSPIETTTVLGGILLAMQEGRPCIVDEMNAIPHHILIALNDLTMRKPGDIVQVPVPGAPPIVVKEGYCFIGTGNYKPEDGERYVARQQMDAAYLSRFAMVAYDYLPMSTEGGTQNDPEKNELYHMVVARLLEEDLSLRVPEGSLEQLEGICRVSRILQNVISDRQISSAHYASINGVDVHPNKVLKENVLSIRHLLPVLDAWKNSGYTKTLEEALFDEYINKSSARPEEKTYVYRMLQLFGEVFKDTSYWPDAVAHPDGVRTFAGVEKRLYGEDSYLGGRSARQQDAANIITYSSKAVVQNLFGNLPVRTDVPVEALRPKKRPQAEAAAEEEKRELSPATRLAIKEALERARQLPPGLLDD